MAAQKKRRSAFSVYQQQMQEEEAATEAANSSMAVVADNNPETGKKAGKNSKRKVAEEKSGRKKKRKLTSGAAKETSTVNGESSPETTKGKSKWKGKLSKSSKSSGKKKASKVHKKKRASVGTADASSTSMDVESSQELEMSGSVKDLDPEGVFLQEHPGAITLDSPFHSQFNPENYNDSREAARDLFRMVINPLPIDKFFSELWEKKPLLLRRHKLHYNDGWFSSEELDHILREHQLQYSTNIDVTAYEDGQRSTHNPNGRAYASAVWKFYKDGCSVRMLNPQAFSQSMWVLCSTLQEYFNSYVGANVYLTPANSQGFAPHYDDIEAFVLQLEGKKHWKLYAPRDESELLPRYSSPNFSQDDLGEPLLDAVLEPGDLLYFPRGVIHQASTFPDTHSLHVTMSTYQKNSWGDLLEKLLPAALEMAMAEDVQFRRGVPTDYLNYMGVVNSDVDDPRRSEFFDKIGSMISNLFQYARVDNVVDQMATNHLHTSLPPCLTEKEQQGGIWGNGAKWQEGEVSNGIELRADTEVRLIRHGVVRLALEEESPALYFTLSNSRVYEERELQGISIEPEDAPAVECLIHSYPEFVEIDSLPMEDGSADEKIELCHILYGQGLLTVKK